MITRILAVLAVLAALAAVWMYITRPATPAQDSLMSAKEAVTRFGQALQHVSLLGPEAEVAREMDENYAPLVSSQLIAKWKADPENAPGRLTSSPWPDRIEIASTTKEASARYRIEGAIIEVTSEGGGIGEQPTEATRRPVSLIVEDIGGRWLITMVTLGAYPAGAQWQYSTPDAQGTQFMYPISLGTKYISTSTEGWPPQVSLVGGDYSCAAADEHVIGDRHLCARRTSEGAAGSTYTTVTYSSAQGDFVASTTFTLRFPQCMNFDEPQQSGCKAEQASYDVDGLADRILSSIRMQ